MTFKDQTTKPRFMLFAGVLQFAIIALSVYVLGSASALKAEVFNQTQTNTANNILTACLQGPQVNAQDFQNRCNGVVGGSGTLDTNSNIIQPLSLTMDPEAISAITEVSPEQTIAPGTQATLANTSQATTVATTLSSRLYALREGLEGTRYAGLQLYRDGNALSDGDSPGQISFYETGGAGDDDFDRLSFWANGSYNFGSVESTFEEIGFQYDNWGVTTGVDYRFTDYLIFGGAFSYLSTDANIAQGGGRVDSDSYTGSIYGTFFVTDGFYVEGIASYGESEFDIDRDIRYVSVDDTGGLPGGLVDTTASGSPDGDQYSFGLGTGYNFSIDALSIEPYARFNYLEFTVDSYSESGGLGWAQNFSEQKIRSATTSLGAQAAYSLSVPFGVVVSQLHGEWVHEYKDNSRKYSTFFLGDGNQNIFRVETDGPDRNYGIVGIAFSTTFAYGISAFLSYDALVGYEDISSHKFTLGTRFEF